MEQVYQNEGWVTAGLIIYHSAGRRLVGVEKGFRRNRLSRGGPLMAGALVATWFVAGTTMGAAGAT
ncbi:hypothetical protein SAMN04487972_101353 [Paracoccus halophilus]|uniref:Uncharacterized protein n=1 Tax=Paracoccus halophilus TaxID=376733 RepID=A0A1I0SJU0_9RHOB|nr:hypothetical protein [Paracoccus halophilus]SFA39784.1 hypothetical protein SAMN04487972_101353 [Paracoccus halophilus]